MAVHRLQAPLSLQSIQTLRAGDIVHLSGTVYTARDAAHKRLMELVEQGEDLPFPLSGAVLYYVGPTPPLDGDVIGSAGPTTSYRMDSYAPALHALGVRATIGKGRRSDELKHSLREHGAVYLGATGGAGALLSRCITEARVIAFDDLGTEAIRQLTVKNLPLVVVYDAVGGDIFLDR